MCMESVPENIGGSIMEFLKKLGRGAESGQKVLMISVDEIFPNPNQPRKIFAQDELEYLAKSIEEMGILQPLTLRKNESGYELIAGERRLRASKSIGLKEVPCLLMDVPEETSSILAVVENIQRQDLDFFEEAQAISHLISRYDISQDEVSKRLGKSQSAVANLLRLLRLSDPIMEKIRQGSCTQRHARALLKIANPELQNEILDKVIAQSLNVSQTEDLIETYLNPPETKEKGKKIIILRDVRLFLNTINKSLNTMKAAGVNAKYVKEELDGEILLTIRIPQGEMAKS